MSQSDITNALWPTNPITIACTAVGALLLIITIIIISLLCSKSRRYKHLDALSKRLMRNPSVSSHTSSRNKAKAKANSDPSNQPPKNRTTSNVDEATQKALSSHRSIDSFVFNGTLIACILLFLSNALTLLYTINSQRYVCCARILTYLQITTFGVSKLLCHLVFVRRLYIAFQSSPDLRYPDWLFIVFSILVCVTALVIVVLIVFISVSYQSYFVYGAASLFAGDFVISIVVLILFISKLKKVVVERLRHTVDDLHSKQIEFQEADRMMIGAITRLTLLSCFTALASLFLVVIFGVRAFVVMEDAQIWKTIYAVNLFFMMNGVANCMSLYLILSFAAEHYERVCNCLHVLILRCCQFGIYGSLYRDRKSFVRHQSDSNTSNTAQTGFSP
eukprot:166290_1